MSPLGLSGRGGGLPGPLARFFRHRGSGWAAVAIAVLAVGSSLLRESSEAQLNVEVDRNWRGSYDILVLPPGLELDIESTNGLVEPNFLSFGGRGGITAEQLNAIRRIEAVELAAPVMTVGYLRHVEPVPSVFTSQLPKQPTVYRLTLTATTNDGLQDRLIQSQVGHVALGPAELDSGDPPPFVSELPFSWGADGVEIAFNPLPSIGGMVIAIDPAAERELLGASAAFLDPLVGVSVTNRNVADFDVTAIPAGDFPHEALQIESARNGVDQLDRAVVPMLVSDRMYSVLSISVEIGAVGTLEDYPDALDSFADSPLAGPSESAELRGFDLLRPFATPSLTVLWPGSSGPDGTSYIAEAPSVIDPTLLHRPRYTPRSPRVSTGMTSFTIHPAGPVTAAGEPLADAGAPPRRLRMEVGREASYRQLDDRAAISAEAPLLAPIGTYDLAGLDLTQNPLSYVPLGAYDPPSTDYVASVDGSPVEPAPVSGTFNPAGLIAGLPLAITDLQGGAALKGGVSIDAIRIRVRGIDSFSPIAQQQIAAVAAEVRALGLDARVVAGASPQPVELYVPAYFVTPEVADLGWVEQRWTTIGAAARVSSALSGSTLVLMGLGLVTAVAFALATHFAQQPTRLREMAIQRSLGWQDAEIRRWHVNEAAAAGALLAAGSVASWLTAGGGGLGLLAGLTVSAVYASGSAIGFLLLTRLIGRPVIMRGGEAAVSPIRHPELSGPVSYGVRAALSRPIRNTAVCVLLAVGGLSVAVGTAIVSVMGTAAGPTLLAGFLTDSLRFGQAAIVLAILAGSASLAAVLGQVDATERLNEWRVLALSGWSKSEVLRARASEVAVSALVSTAVLTLAIVMLAPLLNSSITVQPVLVGVTAVWLTAAVAMAASLKVIWGTTIDA